MVLASPPIATLPPASDASPASVEAEIEQDILATSAAGPAAVRGGALRVIGYVAGSLLSVLSASLLLRHLGVREFGRYATGLSLVALVAALSDLGLTAVGMREMSALAPSERAPVARDLLGLRLALTGLGGLVVVAVAWAAYPSALAFGVALASIGLLLQVTQDNFALPLLVDLRLGWVAALDFARQLSTIALTILLVLTGVGLVPFLAVSIPVGVVLVPASAWLIRGTRMIAPTFNLRRWRTFVAPMLPYTLAVAASALYFRVAIILVSALASGAELGYFGASFRVIEVLTLVPGLVVGSAFPIFARAAGHDHERLGYALGRMFDVTLIAGAFVAVALAVGAPLAIAIVGGPKFAPAASVLAVQGVALGAMFVSLVWANALLSLGLYRTILALNLSTLLLNGLLVAGLVQVDGARGAALGTAIAEIVAALLQALVVAHERPPLRPSLRVVPYVILASAVGLIPLALTGLPTIVRLAISVALFGAVVLVTRALPAELIDLLPWRRVDRGASAP